MDLESIECISSSDGLNKDEIHQHHHSSTLHPSHHPHQHDHDFSNNMPSRNTNNNNINAVAAGLGPTAIAPATSVHELLECPVCMNSMYPPIHQVLNVYGVTGGFNFQNAWSGGYIAELVLVNKWLVLNSAGRFWRIRNSGCSRPLMLSLGLKDHSAVKMKSIVSAVIENHLGNC